MRMYIITKGVIYDVKTLLKLVYCADAQTEEKS